ncbi:NADP-dependent oxidoreductase [Paenibacillus sp. HWE-109]|uniref:NADP-dependent oxidoreductase n=1 Tax=Paenibacillus sp. HWE-109 TaxID=1306526 RepID=UPI001EDEBBFE|nr:NADP-dependent oxidoreductase [Paenibacillus sp. HWE-109]UKS30510.1 NADP-dependent oxidoreductase [Paenibacillus sp. HWE-109]
MSGKMMQAVRYHQFGGSEVLHVEEVTIPEPSENEVLVRIVAAGVLPVDWKIRKGRLPMPIQFPYLPGTAFSGVIAEVGAGVTDFQIGQQVFGRSTKGTYAQYTTAPTAAIALKPYSLSFDEAAAISGGATTAWRAIVEDGNVQAGERVLIHGAAGGVGQFAIQFAKWRGAYVIGTAGSGNIEFVRSLGADEVIDYNAARFEETANEMDLVLDTVGGETLERSMSVIKRGGRLITIADQPSMEKAKELGIKVVRGSLATSKDLTAIARLIDEGIVRTTIGPAYTLHEVRQAHERSETGHGRGRIVLHIEE